MNFIRDSIVIPLDNSEAARQMLDRNVCLIDDAHSEITEVRQLDFFITAARPGWFSGDRIGLMT